jgi:hypothetical protein
VKQLPQPSSSVDVLASQMSRVSLSRKSAPPEKPLGSEIEMSVEGVLTYCRQKQDVINKLNLNTYERIRPSLSFQGERIQLRW